MKRLGLVAVVFATIVSCVREDYSGVHDRVILIGGSNTELDLVKDLVQKFKTSNPHIEENFLITGEGSNTGINDLIYGNVKIANASRFMTDSEIEIAEMNGIRPVKAIIARDAIAIITNSRVGVDSLSMIELKDVFSGKITNWKELGGVDAAIVIYGRNENSGTRPFIKARLLNGESDAHIMEKQTQREILNAVKVNVGGIGYIGIGALCDENGKPSHEVWAMNLYYDGGVATSPYEKVAVENEVYPLTRPLFQYYANNPTGPTKELMNFILSNEGQSIVRKHGFYPINDMQKYINRENLNAAVLGD